MRVLALWLIAALAAAVVDGCESSSNPKLSARAASCPAPPGSARQVPLLVTSNAALGPLLAFELQLDQVTLNDACGNAVPLLAAPLTVEWTHVNGVSEPLLLAHVPQATYTSATVTYEDPDVAYLWPGKLDFVANIVTTGAVTRQASFSAPIVVKSAPTSILLDTLLTQPFQTTGKTNTVSLAFQVTQVPVAARPTGEVNGKLEFRGLVTSADLGNGNLTVIDAAGIAQPVATGTATEYEGIAGEDSVPVPSPVDLQVAIQSDGSLFANRVQVDDTTADSAWTGPLVVSAPRLGYDELLPRQIQTAKPFGNEMPQLYSNYPAYFSLADDTDYGISSADFDLADLPFSPTFASANDMALGQGLSVGYATQQQVTDASSITLVPRTFSGTVTAVSNGGKYTAYTLALAANDLLATLTGVTSLTAYTNAGTRLESATPIAAGSAVNLRGLLFDDGGTLRLVCNQVRLQIVP